MDKLIELIEKHMVLSLMRSDHREEMNRIYNNSVNAARACQQIRKIFRGEEVMTDQSQSQPQSQPQQEFVSNNGQYQQPPFQLPQMPQYNQQQYAPYQYAQQEPRQNEQLVGEFDAIMNELSQLSNLIMSVQRKLYGICMKLK